MRSDDIYQILSSDHGFNRGTITINPHLRFHDLTEARKVSSTGFDFSIAFDSKNTRQRCVTARLYVLLWTPETTWPDVGNVKLIVPAVVDWRGGRGTWRGNRGQPCELVCSISSNWMDRGSETSLLSQIVGNQVFHARALTESAHGNAFRVTVERG